MVMFRRRVSRSAFTLVELLVVITIIGILMGMLMPAVNYARESGRQAQCKTNLKNLGIALEAYHQQYGSLPYGAVANVSRSGDTNWSVGSPRGSALHSLLPFIDLRTIYDLFSFPSKTNPEVTGTNYTVLKFRIPVFVCPSDDFRGQKPGDGYALHSYVASGGPVKVGVEKHSSGGKSCDQASKYNAGLDTINSRLRGLGRPNMKRSDAPGPFAVHTISGTTVSPSPVSHAMIRDGLSNTIMVGEVRPKCTQEVYWRGWSQTWNGCGLVSTLVPINYDSCDPSTQFTGNPCQSANNGSVALGFKSAHPGGAHFVLGDGHVAFFQEGIDPWTFNLLGAIDDGLPVKLP
jgi:prepilin-type N-terminal cleavage/methylation domain-containing protein/prepilin-type processing-associated H-X9-DG protein